MIINSLALFDAIRNNKDDWWKGAMILLLNVPVENKYKLGEMIIKNESAFNWFVNKLNGGDNYA